MGAKDITKQKGFQMNRKTTEQKKNKRIRVHKYPLKGGRAMKKTTKQMMDKFNLTEKQINQLACAIPLTQEMRDELYSIPGWKEFCEQEETQEQKDLIGG